MTEVPPAARGFGSLLLWAGAAFALAALLFDVRLVSALRPDAAPTPESLHETRTTRVLFALTAAALAFVGFLERTRGRPLRRRISGRLATALLALFLPLFFLERALAPFVEHPTTIYLRDAELGWKLAPGASDFWMGVPVRINAKGLRGPERPYEKPAGTRRVLFLGDSVTFGARVADDEALFSAQVEALLRERSSVVVECINAGVGGYSPWQEAILLREECKDYDPDVVVLMFVLNDVTELYELEQFGGAGQGFQLDHTRRPGLHGWFMDSAIHHFARKLGARFRFGPDVQESVRRTELLGLQHLVLEPKRAGVLGAWQLTLNSVEEIAGWCRKRELPLLIALVPWLPQLERPGMMAPNEHLRAWCETRSIPFLDLAPELAARARERGVEPGLLYVPDDAIHPSELGHELLGAALADELEARGWLAQ